MKPGRKYVLLDPGFHALPLDFEGCTVQIVQRVSGLLSWEIRVLVDGVWDEGWYMHDEPSTVSASPPDNPCRCPVQTLMRSGCQCGGE